MTPYLEGMRARLYGRPLRWNPYDGGAESDAWELGWRDEDSTIRQEGEDE